MQLYRPELLKDPVETRFIVCRNDDGDLDGDGLYRVGASPTVGPELFPETWKRCTCYLQDPTWKPLVGKPVLSQ